MIGLRSCALVMSVALPLVTKCCINCPKPSVHATPASVTFAPQVVNPTGTASAAQPVTVTNTGNASASITAVNVSGDYSEMNNCLGTLAASASCTVQVMFKPNAVGAINGTLQVVSSGGNPEVALFATGLPPVGFSPVTLDFGTIAVGASSTAQAVVVTNQQSSALAIQSIATSGNYSQTNNCPASLSASQTCTVNVTFHPTLSGVIPGVLSVATDASPGTQPVGLTGQGSGTTASSLSFSPVSLSFGDQEAGMTSAAQTVTLKNTSATSSVTVNGILTLGANYASTDTCKGKMLAPGDTCTVNVTFKPSANFATVDYPGAVSVSDSSSTSPEAIGLSGSGVGPISAGPDSVDFGHTALNATIAPQTVTLHNNDPAAENITVANGGNAFQVTNNCAASLNPGDKCTVDVSYGGAVGPHSGELTVSSSSGSFLSPKVVNLAACGTQVGLVPSSFNFGAVNVGSTSSTVTAILDNTLGGPNLNISGIGLAGTNAIDFTLTNNTCGATLTAGTSCTFDLGFRPNASGIRTAVLNVTDDGVCSPQVVNLQGGSAAGPFIVTVVGQGTGAGNVTSSPAGINCGNGGTVCSFSFPAGTSVTLTATPDSTSSFTGWGGACSGTGTCVLDMTSDKLVTASAKRFPLLTVGTSGTGGGNITSNPAGIDCPGSALCTAYYPDGTQVTLTAVSNSVSVFTGWSGACSGKGTCTVTMNSDLSVTANFVTATLTVNLPGNGGGTVVSAPAGLNCTGAPCTASFLPGTVVTLTATPNNTSAFTGWSGACSGSGTCTVTMSTDQTVSATFTSTTLSVTMAGNGGGTVTSAPSGIACPATACAASFVPGTVVSLAATANSGSSLTWSGACSGSGACTITMSADQSVTATFTAPDFTVAASAPSPSTVTAGGSSTSTVTIGSLNGLNSAVALSCAVTPLVASGPTCSLPASVTPAANGTVTANIAITTFAPHTALLRDVGHSPILYALGLPFLGVVFAGIRGRQRSGQKLACVLMGGALFLALLVQSACGGGSKPPVGGTPPGAYTIIVTGSADGFQHSTPIIVTVQ